MYPQANFTLTSILPSPNMRSHPYFNRRNWIKKIVPFQVADFTWKIWVFILFILKFVFKDFDIWLELLDRWSVWFFCSNCFQLTFSHHHHFLPLRLKMKFKSSQLGSYFHPDFTLISPLPNYSLVDLLFHPNGRGPTSLSFHSSSNDFTAE